MLPQIGSGAYRDGFNFFDFGLILSLVSLLPAIAVPELDSLRQRNVQVVLQVSQVEQGQVRLLPFSGWPWCSNESQDYDIRVKLYGVIRF